MIHIARLFRLEARLARLGWSLEDHAGLVWSIPSKDGRWRCELRDARTGGRIGPEGPIVLTSTRDDRMSTYASLGDFLDAEEALRRGITKGRRLR